MRVLIVSLILSLTVGCAFNAGTVRMDADGAQTCKGIFPSFGDTVGPCGMKGGVISVPGGMVIGGIFKGVADFATAMFATPPIIINHAPPAESPDKED